MVYDLILVLSAKSLCHVQLFATPWTVAHQGPLSMQFSRQEYWGGLCFLLQGILPTRGSMEPASPMSPALAGTFFTANATWEFTSSILWDEYTIVPIFQMRKQAQKMVNDLPRVTQLPRSKTGFTLIFLKSHVPYYGALLSLHIAERF